MSKCQKNKYLVGGKAGVGGSGTCVKEDTQGVAASFAALAAAREAQMASLWGSGSGSEPTQAQSQAIVVHEQQTKKQTRSEDIQCILNGDYE